MNDLQAFVYVSIISADNDEFGLSEEDKQDIMSRRDSSNDWSYILEPIKDEDVRKTLIKFFDNATD